MKGVDETIDTFKQFQSMLARLKSANQQVIMYDSVRLAPTGTQINERGSLKDRLAQTDEEAETLARVEDVRLGRESTEPANQAEQDAIDDAIIDRLVDDFVENAMQE